MAAIDPELPLDRVTTIAAFRHGVTWYYRVFGFLLLAFGLGALVLALVGVYAVMSFGVARRRREIGVRMALGADRASIVRLMLRESAAFAAAGIAAGTLLALAASRFMKGLLFEVPATDPATYATLALAVAAIVALASYAPARRAASANPAEALRS